MIYNGVIVKSFLKIAAWGVMAIYSGCFLAKADPINISYNYAWQSGTTAETQTLVTNTMAAVARYYESVFSASYTGETWQINVNWTNLTTPDKTNVGSAGPDLYYTGADILAANTNASVNTNLDYALSLADHLAGTNFTGTNTALTLSMNASLTNWDWSTTNKADGNESFYTTAIHEIGHGLGFLSTLDVTNGTYLYTNPTIFDDYLTLGTNTNSSDYLVNMTASNRVLAVTSSNLYFNGSNATLTNGGAVAIYAPSTAEDGSSLSHLDFSVNTNASLIMYPNASTNPENFSYSSTELAIYQDLGYTVVPEPASGEMVILGGGLLLLAWRLSRRQACFQNVFR